MQFRKKSIENKVDKLIRGERVFVTLGGYESMYDEPLALQEKFGLPTTWFPGYEGALNLDSAVEGTKST